MDFNSIRFVRRQRLPGEDMSATPYRVVETKSRQNGTFDPCGHEVTPAPARFWDRGARWFVGRLYVLEQPGDELQRFFGEDSLPL